MNINNFKNYLLEHRFRKFILEKDGVLKITFKTPVVFFQPSAFCLSNENGDYLCIEDIRDINVEENEWGTELTIFKEEEISPVNLWCI